MKNKTLKRMMILSMIIPALLVGCNSNSVVGPKGEQGDVGPKGEDGLTPYIGENNNWWIGDYDTGVPAEGKDGKNGVSVVSTNIDENGDLIIAFSNGEVINAGHVTNNNLYHTVNFYCDDLIVGTKNVKHGEKVEPPELTDFIVKHWYIDKAFEYEWFCYGCVVTEDMSLYGKYTPVTYDVVFNKSTCINIDEYGYGDVCIDDKELCVSKAFETNDYLTVLDERGIAFNKLGMGYIDKLTINISPDNFSSVDLYYGRTPLSFENHNELCSGTNVIDLSDVEYFTIQNTGSNAIRIISIEVEYHKKMSSNVDSSIPTISINTKDSEDVLSRLSYVDCSISTFGAEKDVNEIKAQIKVRGNTTSYSIKKPYRIKLDKKTSLFGYTKAKNWVLLADYLDGSNMHNYTALEFAKMVRGKDSFAVTPMHVNVILNGENIGLYLFGEHIDAKDGRLNIEQDNLWEKSFDEMNFYIERDASTAREYGEIEGETYFKVDLEDYSPSQYVFALKYPEKDDFVEELDDGTIIPHEEEFNSFFSSLVEYMTNICNKFVNYSKNNNEFQSIQESVDVNSLAMYSVIDQALTERDHEQKSFKMYRSNGGLLKFGPNWDYDSCAYGLPIIWEDNQGFYVDNPFKVGSKTFTSTYFGEKWGYTLFNDVENGRPLFKSIWDSISEDKLNEFLNLQLEEISNISLYSIYDCEKWMNNKFYCLFDNLHYYWKYVSTQLPYLKNLY